MWVQTQGVPGDLTDQFPPPHFATVAAASYLPLTPTPTPSPLPLSLLPPPPPPATTAIAGASSSISISASNWAPVPPSTTTSRPSQPPPPPALPTAAASEGYPDHALPSESAQLVLEFPSPQPRRRNPRPGPRRNSRDRNGFIALDDSVTLILNSLSLDLYPPAVPTATSTLSSGVPSSTAWAASSPKVPHTYRDDPRQQWPPPRKESLSIRTRTPWVWILCLCPPLLSPLPPPFSPYALRYWVHALHLRKLSLGRCYGASNPPPWASLHPPRHTHYLPPFSRYSFHASAVKKACTQESIWPRQRSKEIWAFERWKKGSSMANDLLLCAPAPIAYR